MKKIFFMAVSAVLLAAGCQKTEIQNEMLPQIGFKTQMGKLTKAPDAGKVGKFENLQEQGFMVWGYFATENDLNYNRYDLYLGTTETQEVEVSGKKETVTTELGVDVTYADASWTTGNNVYYWPGKGKELDLYAVSLWDGQTPVNNTYAKNVSIVPEDYTLNITGFVVNDDADDDLMVAPMITQDQDDSQYVEPEFTHALTKVLVKFTTTAPVVDKKNESGQVIGTTNGVYIVDAKITGVNSTANLQVVNRPMAEVTTGATKYIAEFTWSGETAARSYVAQYNGTSEQVHAAPSGVTATTTYPAYAVPTYDSQNPNAASNYMTFGSWLLIPQTSLTGVTLEVTYIVDNVLVNTTFELGTGVSTWAYGMQTTYNVRITPEYITFDPIVEEWTNEGDINHGDYEEETQQTVTYTEVENVNYQPVDGTASKCVIRYEGTLQVGTEVFVKEGENYNSAPAGTYTFGEGEAATVLVVEEKGVVKAINPGQQA